MNMKLIGLCLIAVLCTVAVTYAAYTYVNINPEEGTIGEIEQRGRVGSQKRWCPKAVGVHNYRETYRTPV